MKKKIFNIICCIIIFLLTCLSFIFSNEVSTSLYETIIFLFKVILPSLFPFMIFVNFILLSNCIDYLSIIFKPLGKIFNITGYGISVIIASILGGFPYSAILVENFVRNKKISLNEGKRLALYMFFPSFSFLYNNLYQKDIFIITSIISLYLTSFIFLYFSKFKYNEQLKSNINIQINNKFDDMYFNVMNKTFQSIFSIAFSIIFFNILSSLLPPFITNKFILNLISGVFEFSKTSIVLINKIDKSFIDYILLNFILSFSSLSIIIQSFYHLKNIKIGIKKLLISRLAISLVSSILFTIIYIIC